MIDTHTHLYMSDYGDGGGEGVENALAAGVSHMVLPGVCPSSHDAMVSLHRRYPESTSMCLGLHPTEVWDGESVDTTPELERRCHENWSDVLDRLEPLLESGEYVAIGETGIDLHWDRTTLPLQKLAFERQLRWGAKHGLPVVIHCREGFDETIEVLSRVKEDVGLPTLVFHSFTSNVEDVRKVREVCDPYFGINGVATFKNAAYLREALPEIGIDRIVLETDAPFLAPVPHRGKRNESAYIPLIRDCVADTLGLLPSKVEEITDNNAKKIFRL